MTSERRINRVESLDLLRGYFLFVIILNHLYFYPSGYEFITGKSLLFASAAEGFFIISGIVLGIVRGAKLHDKPLKTVSKLLLGRAWQLYITYVLLVLFFTFVGWLVIDNPGIKPGIYLPVGDTLSMIWNAITLQYIYGWADYLRLYAIFIAFAPIAVWLLRKKLWYVVALSSIGVWMLFPAETPPSGWLFHPLSWQLLFFGGFIVGFHWLNIKTWWHQLAQTSRHIVLGCILPLAAVTFVGSILLSFGGELPGIGEWLATTHEEIRGAFDKDRLPPARLLLAALWFIALFWLFHRYARSIKKWFGWLLESFGQNSLYVYTVHAFVVFFITLIVPRSETWWYNFIVSTAVVGLIYLAVKRKFLMKIIPR